MQPSVTMGILILALFSEYFVISVESEGQVEDILPTKSEYARIRTHNRRILKHKFFGKYLRGKLIKEARRKIQQIKSKFNRLMKKQMEDGYNSKRQIDPTEVQLSQKKAFDFRFLRLG